MSPVAQWFSEHWFVISLVVVFLAALLCWAFIYGAGTVSKQEGDDSGDDWLGM